LTEEGPTTEEIRMAEEAVRQNEALLEAAKANVARKQVSAEDVEAARTAVRQAEEMLRIAQANKAQYKLVKDDIRAAAAAVQQARAQVAYIAEQLRQTRIFSPVSGVVAQRTVNVGETVAPGAVLMHVVALDTVYFEAQVPERDVPDVRPGLPVQVTVDALPHRTIPAVVRQVILVAERESKQFRVRVSVENPHGDLPPGGFARGVIEVGARRNVLLVPKAALYTEAGETFVYRIVNGRAQRRTVQVGLRDERNAEVLAGLQEGQQVVAGGFVSEGTKVQPVNNDKSS
ncbi:MAG: efflux RND transporter periplasmic adaptor subunit, partial [Abditibacteriales bacterium]|nr:efflux RND transporter periplasmic adaptor subunit [Abditibacteriales bacterium]MDW8366441.1 efflux RND transporter periplasmic adaptor subunit [Abditibacteriales bacterium]